MKFPFLKMTQQFPKPYEPFGADISLKIDLSNYAIKTYLQNATGTDTSKLAPKSDLVSLEADINQLDIDELASVHAELRKLIDVVKNDVVKKLCMSISCKSK